MSKEKKMFRGDWNFLSNFYTTPQTFTWMGLSWTCSENAFQWAKLPNKLREKPVFAGIFQKITAAESKALGKIITLRDDWDDIKVDIMTQVLEQKFESPIMTYKLQDTGDQELVEWNTWYDVFWGKDIKSGDGENHLGKILMKIRKSKT